MDALYIAYLVGFLGFFLAFAWASYAHVRLTRIERATRDLDWQQVSEIGLDVQKLKKSSQKWQNNENAQVKVTQKELLEQAMLERAMQQQNPKPLKIVEY